MSKPPDLVFNEPVATGWMRTELYGDRARAGAMIPLARAQMGWMRTIYGVNQRIAEGDAGGFYAQVRQLDDGTMIQTITNNGFDIIRIDAPPPQPKPRRRRDTDQQIGVIAVCGTCLNPDFIRQAVLWTVVSAYTNTGQEMPRDEVNPPVFEVTPLEMMENGFRAEAADVSGDGTVVVGNCLTWDGNIRAFRWTPPVDDPLDPRYPGGMKDLGRLWENGNENYATSVSADGSMVVGYGYDLGVAWRGWLWTEAFGLTKLPDGGIGVQPRRLSISPNGRYITGLVAVPLEELQNAQAAVWEVTEVDPVEGPQIAGPFLIEQPGTYSTIVVGSGPSGPTPMPPQILEDKRDTCWPTDVTDDGLVYGHTTHQELLTWQSHSVTTTPDGGFESSGTYYTPDPKQVQNVFTYDSVGGEFKIIGDATSTGYANEAGLAVGHAVLAPLVSRSFAYDDTSPETGEVWHTVLTFSEIELQKFWSWVLTPQFDQFGNITGYVQTPLGDFTKALDISPDGKAICGLRGDLETNEYPVVWVDPFGQLDLPLPDGWGQGRATAISNFQHRETNTTDD